MHEQNSEGPAHSLWFVPSGAVYTNAKRMISQLSAAYSTPEFEPHVTLLGNVAGDRRFLLAKTTELAARLSRFDIRLTTLDFLDEYFQCLFIRAELSQGLSRANLVAREIFNREDDLEYMPHLSLLYGNLSRETKEQILSEVGRDMSMTFTVEDVHLVAASAHIAPKEWHTVGRFELAKRPQ